MFVFLIPRTPLKYRNPLRNELWELCKVALLSQTSSNWKAIIIGDTSDDKFKAENILSLPFDEYDKIEKLEMALNFIKTWTIKPDYLIRLDDDDIVSPKVLSFIERLSLKHDCYFDARHACIDIVYLKVSYKKNTWFANTIIHKYEHAIQKCGKENKKILLQHHNEYWHQYYSSKNTFSMPINKVIYYRVLSPFSITSSLSSTDKNIQWSQHLLYLNGYGPWVTLPLTFYYYKPLKDISNAYFNNKPLRQSSYWLINLLKFLKNRFLNI